MVAAGMMSRRARAVVVRYRLGAVLDAELAQDVLDVGLDRALGDDEPRGDAGVGLALSQHGQHLELPAGKHPAEWPGRRSGRPLATARVELGAGQVGHTGLGLAGPSEGPPRL